MLILRLLVQHILMKMFMFSHGICTAFTFLQIFEGFLPFVDVHPSHVEIMVCRAHKQAQPDKNIFKVSGQILQYYLEKILYLFLKNLYLSLWRWKVSVEIEATFPDSDTFWASGSFFYFITRILIPGLGIVWMDSYNIKL